MDANEMKRAEQFRKAVQFVINVLSEEKAMQIATVYAPYEEGKEYEADDYFTYGENSVGDPQLYRVVQAHTSQADWKPDSTPSLYKAIGLDDAGYPIWSQPTGAHDAYNKGDIVDYNGTLYISEVDGNIYAPGIIEGQWTVYIQ